MRKKVWICSICVEISIVVILSAFALLIILGTRMEPQDKTSEGEVSLDMSVSCVNGYAVVVMVDPRLSDIELIDANGGRVKCNEV